MNRYVRLSLVAAVLAMLLIGGTAVGLKWQAGAIANGEVRESVLAPLLLLGLPAFFGGMIVVAERYLASARPRLSDDHRRHIQGALIFWYVVVTGICGWVALRYLHPGPAAGGRDTFIRLLSVLIGVAMAVRGNFFAKLSPPVGDGAPDAAAWTRTALRTGWILSVLGAALVLCAIALPLRSLFFVLIATAPVVVGLGAVQGRIMRPRLKVGG